MRDKKRIFDFCNKLAIVWEKECPDWRFGQMVCNIFGEMAGEGRDPFFPEEDEMIAYIEKYFYKKDKIKK